MAIPGTNLRMQTEISKFEDELKADASNLSAMINLTKLYIEVGSSKVDALLRASIKTFKANAPSDAGRGTEIIDNCINFWKSQRYLDKDSLRVNYTPARKEYIQLALDIIRTLKQHCSPADIQMLDGRLAFIYECLGMFKEAISILSDQIANQTMESELSYQIFKAAFLLMHVGGNAKQVIEYLDYLVDDPPVAFGFGKTNIVAGLAAIYETSSSQYRVALFETYGRLHESYKHDVGEQKMERMLGNKDIMKISEIWEILGLQAVERCEYIVALELMRVACAKAPTKNKVLHATAEIHFTLGETDACLRLAELAYGGQGKSAELRNLLLAAAPERWADKLRQTPAKPREDATKAAEAEADSDDDLGKSDDGRRRQRELGDGNDDNAKKDGDDPEDMHWLAKIRNKAEKTVFKKKDKMSQKEQQRHDLGALRRSAKPNASNDECGDADNEASDTEGGASNALSVVVAGSPRSPPKKNSPKSKSSSKAIVPYASRELATSKRDDKGSPRPPREESQRDPNAEPLRPVKPLMNKDSSRVLKLAKSGNENIHLYDEDLEEFRKCMAEFEKRKQNSYQENEFVAKRMHEMSLKPKKMSRAFS
jgi:hypothetical protein